MFTMVVRLLYLLTFLSGVFVLPSYIVFKFITPKIKVDFIKVLVAIVSWLILVGAMFLLISGAAANIVLYEQSSGACFGISCSF